MSASNAFETLLLQHILQNAALAGLGDAAGCPGSAAAGNVYVGLHTADPGEGGTQATNEATYTGYARVAVARSAGGWAVAGNAYSNAAAVGYPACTAGNNAISHFSIGMAANGAGTLMLKGVLSGAVAISAGITPSFAVGELSGTAD